MWRRKDSFSHEKDPLQEGNPAAYVVDFNPYLDVEDTHGTPQPGAYGENTDFVLGANSGVAPFSVLDTLLKVGDD